MPEFFTSRNIKATRKVHQCEVCLKIIPAGAPAFYFALKADGEFYDGHYHDDCRAAEVALNDLRDTYGDEWISLCYIRDEHEDVVWLKAEYPAVAARMFTEDLRFPDHDRLVEG